MDEAERPSSLARRVGRVAAFFVAYYLLGELSYRAAFHRGGSLAVWWAPSGLALAALVRAGRRTRPWLVAAIFVAATAVNAGQPIRLVELPFRSFADCVEPMAGAWLLRRWAGPRATLHTLREVAQFALAGCTVGPTVGTVAAVLFAVALGRPPASAGGFALMWWGSAALGASLFAPVILAWRTPSHWPSRQRLGESTLLTTLLLVVSVGSFYIPTASPFVLLVGFAAFPLLGWSAVRFGPAGAARSAVTLSLFSLWPFFNGWRSPAPWQVFVTQTIYAVGILTSLALSALVAETRRLRARADLQARAAEESLALLESALKGAPFGIAFFDATLHLTRWNPVFSGLAGAPDASLGGRSLEDAMPALAPSLIPLLQSSLRDGPVDLDLETERAGQRRAWRASAFAVRFQGTEPLGAGLLLIDDTERRVAEEERGRLFRAAQEAVQVREDFLSIASHELKTPLTPIFARLGHLKRKLAAGQPISEESIDKTLVGLRKLTELINDLLDASRIQYGRLMLHKAPQPMGDIVRRGAEPFRGVSPVHQLVLDLSREPLWADVDAQRLTQVVTNLVDNAIKYSPAGGRIEVRLHPHPEGLELTVSDPGLGLSAAQKERLFERFYRVATGTVSSGGLGLGLYISRDIVERHGGRIWAESEPGRGSRFHVVLPRIPPARLPQTLH